MGHFGRRPISRAWFFIVFPALMINYMGQGSLILAQPSAISNPFYLLMPEWAQVPMIFLATIATLIASQAVISGAFSVTRQAIQLGFLPRLTIRHTSGEAIGQVYVPAVNWGLFAAVVALVIGFGSSAKLATAYGIAVTGTLLVDSVLFLFVVRLLWRKPLWMVVAGVLGFVTVDLLFLAANVTKILHGGWFPLLVGARCPVVMTTWDRGRADVTAARVKAEGPLGEFVERMHARVPPMRRLPGAAIYLNPSPHTTPLALRVGVDRIHAIPEEVVIVTVRRPTSRTSRPPSARRSTTWATTTTATATSRCASATSTIPSSRRRSRWRATRRAGGWTSTPPRHVLPVADHHRSRARARDGLVAQEAVRRDGAQRRQPHRVLQPPAERVVTLGSRIRF